MKTPIRLFPYGELYGSLAGPGGTNDDGRCGANGQWRRQTFVTSLWPYLEEVNLYQSYDFNYAFYSSHNAAAIRTQTPVYFCPSDRQGMWKGDGYYRSRGNYVLNWGYCDYSQTQPSGYELGPFGANRQSTAATIGDGLSNTMFMGEVIQALHDTDWDIRGDFFNTGGAAQFMTLSTPNAGIDSTLCIPTSDDPGPCQMGGPVYVSARSRHPGGVNTVFGDGSTHFIGNSIAVDTWRALSSSNGNELIGGEAF